MSELKKMALFLMIVSAIVLVEGLAQLLFGQVLGQAFRGVLLGVLAMLYVRQLQKVAILEHMVNAAMEANRALRGGQVGNAIDEEMEL